MCAMCAPEQYQYITPNSYTIANVSLVGLNYAQSQKTLRKPEAS